MDLGVHSSVGSNTGILYWLLVFPVQASGIHQVSLLGAPPCSVQRECRQGIVVGWLLALMGDPPLE